MVIATGPGCSARLAPPERHEMDPGASGHSPLATPTIAVLVDQVAFLRRVRGDAGAASKHPLTNELSGHLAGMRGITIDEPGHEPQHPFQALHISAALNQLVEQGLSPKELASVGGKRSCGNPGNDLAAEHRRPRSSI